MVSPLGSSDRIFFGGFASGLDTQGIIDALIAVQSRPILIQQNRRIGLDTYVFLSINLCVYCCLLSTSE